ncbi:MAG: rRNA maturation RNase YbeY [Longimicrobiales bacterium]|jgi:rRNA maturation RNase YbeY
MNVQVNTNGFEDAPLKLLRCAVERVLRGAADQAEVSLTLVSDEEITSLNREYLGKDRPTDVIAFNLGDEHVPLGDVYVCVSQAERQAVELNVSVKEELTRLAIHGTLHVMGEDHPEGLDRLESPMFVLQERLLSEVLAGGC